jgi:phosphohistidine phosphatase
MPSLLVIRHAKTESDAASGRDFDRELLPRGRDDARTIGRHLARLGHLRGPIHCSTAARARQTLELLLESAPAADPVAHFEELYLAELDTLLGRIAATPDDVEQLTIVGHNSGLEDLVGALTGSPLPMPTAGYALIRFEPPRWADVAIGSGKLIEAESPASLAFGRVR